MNLLFNPTCLNRRLLSNHTHTHIYNHFSRSAWISLTLFHHPSLFLPAIRSTSLMSSSLLLQQCPACLVGLILIVFVMGGRWPYSCCFVGCCLQDLVNIARSILVYLLSSFFSIRLVSVCVVHRYSSIDTTVAWKKLCFMEDKEFRWLIALTLRHRL